MTPHEPSREPVLAVDTDPVAALRASVERLLIPVEQHLDEWDIELPQALAGPRVTPALRERLAALRASAQRCRAAGEAMVAAAESAAAETRASAALVRDDIKEPPTGGGEVA